jgi:hypothetical protein
VAVKSLLYGRGRHVRDRVRSCTAHRFHKREPSSVTSRQAREHETRIRRDLLRLWRSLGRRSRSFS